MIKTRKYDAKSADTRFKPGNSGKPKSVFEKGVPWAAWTWFRGVSV